MSRAAPLRASEAITVRTNVDSPLSSTGTNVFWGNGNLLLPVLLYQFPACPMNPTHPFSANRALLHALLLAFVMATAVTALSQSITVYDRQFSWSARMQCIAEKLIEFYQKYLPGGFLNLYQHIPRELGFSARMGANGQGSIVSSTITEWDQGVSLTGAGASSGGASLGFGLTTSTATIEVDNQTKGVFFVYKDSNGEVTSLQVGYVRGSDGLFVRSGPGGACLDLKSEQVTPVQMPASISWQEADPGFRVEPQTYTYWVQFMIWTGIDSPVIVVARSVSITIYVIVPENDPYNELQA